VVVHSIADPRCDRTDMAAMPPALDAAAVVDFLRRRASEAAAAKQVEGERESPLAKRDFEMAGELQIASHCRGRLLPVEFTYSVPS